jgi:DNA-binding Lrp family transcriptional regulator
MKQNSIKLDHNETKFLLSLLKDGSKKDAEIARETGISKATFHRIRKKLEKDGVISEYIPIIDFDRIGVEIFQVVILQWLKFSDKKLSEKVFNEWENDPHVIFLANGQGAKFSTVLFMGFTNIHEYDDYMRTWKSKYEQYIGTTETLILPSTGLVKTDFTDLVSHVLKNGGHHK